MRSLSGKAARRSSAFFLFRFIKCFLRMTRKSRKNQFKRRCTDSQKKTLSCFKKKNFLNREFIKKWDVLTWLLKPKFDWIISWKKFCFHFSWIFSFVKSWKIFWIFFLLSGQQGSEFSGLILNLQIMWFFCRFLPSFRIF